MIENSGRYGRVYQPCVPLGDVLSGVEVVAGAKMAGAKALRYERTFLLRNSGECTEAALTTSSSLSRLAGSPPTTWRRITLNTAELWHTGGEMRKSRL